MEYKGLSELQLRSIFRQINRFMILLWRLGLGSWGNPTRFGGAIMVIKHTGRRSGLARLTPVNFALVGGDIYCTSGFGKIADWYRNTLANPQVEVWLPDGRWLGTAEDVTTAKYAPGVLRQVIVASGFAGPMFGINPKQMSDDEFEALLKSCQLVRIRRTTAQTGPDGPGDLAWIWPTTTAVLLWLLLRKRRRGAKNALG